MLFCKCEWSIFHVNINILKKAVLVHLLVIYVLVWTEDLGAYFSKKWKKLGQSYRIGLPCFAPRHSRINLWHLIMPPKHCQEYFLSTKPVVIKQTNINKHKCCGVCSLRVRIAMFGGWAFLLGRFLKISSELTLVLVTQIPIFITSCGTVENF